MLQFYSDKNNDIVIIDDKKWETRKICECYDKNGILISCETKYHDDDDDDDYCTCVEDDDDDDYCTCVEDDDDDDYCTCVEIECMIIHDGHNFQTIDKDDYTEIDDFGIDADDVIKEMEFVEEDNFRKYYKHDKLPKYFIVESFHNGEWADYYLWKIDDYKKVYF